MSYKITKLTTADVLLAKRLIYEWQVEDGVQEPVVPGDEYLQKLLGQDTFHAFVATDESLVIGGLSAYEMRMFTSEEDEIFLYEIGVNEHYRQRGVARAMIDELKKVCVTKGINTFYVGTATDNEPAKKLYKATGGDMELIPWFTYDLGLGRVADPPKI